MVAIHVIAGILGLAYSIVMLLAVLDIQKSLKQLVRWQEERDIKARREPAINSPVIPATEDDVDDENITRLADAINKNKKLKG